MKPRDERDWLFLLLGFVEGLVVALLITAVLASTACMVPDEGSLQDPAVGGTALEAVQMCRENITIPCGWVYTCGSMYEWCLPWEDRAEIPKLKETLESLYGDCEISGAARFAGVPICLYMCPPTVPKLCNCKTSPGGCFCLDTP